MRFLHPLLLTGFSLLAACGGSVDDSSPADSATDGGVTDSAIARDTATGTDSSAADVTVIEVSPEDTAPAVDTAPKVDAAFFDVIIQGEGLDAWEGKTITFVTVNDPTPSGITVTGKVVGGKVTASFPATMSKSVFGFFVDVWIDMGGDGACNTGTDPIYTHFVSNSFKDPVVSTFKAGTSDPKTDCSKLGMR